MISPEPDQDSFPYVSAAPEPQGVTIDHLLTMRADDGKEPCPECGMRYVPGTGMGVHRRVAHNVKGSSHPERSGGKLERKICPECHKPIATNSLARHRRKVHHVDTTRKVQTKAGDLGNPLLPDAILTQEVSADEVLMAISNMLWPAGIPTRSLPALLRWRTATEVFLREVR